MFLAQIFITKPGKWGSAEGDIFDSRWYLGGDVEACPARIPEIGGIRALKKDQAPVHPLIPQKVFERSSDLPFGSWKDFDLSVCVDGM